MMFHNVELMKSAAPGTEPGIDALCWPEFATAISRAADTLGVSYIAVRSVVIDYYERQTTFHLAALAESVLDFPHAHVARHVRERLGVPA